MERALSGSVSAVESHSPQVTSQESVPQPKNGSPRSSRETVFNNLINSPLLFMDSCGYIIDRLASEIEDLRLRRDPVFRGKEKLSGDGSTVIILPGLATWESEFDDTKTYFSRSGHRAITYFPQVVNLGQVNVLLEGSKDFVKEQAEKSKSKVQLMGHSLGAYFIRIIAHEQPRLLKDYVKKIFLLGAPAGGRVNTVVETLFLASHLPFSARQIEDFVESLRNLPEKVDIPGIDVYEIESACDLIVQRQNGNADDDVVTFRSSHRALPRDPDVLRYIAQRLAA